MPAVCGSQKRALDSTGTGVTDGCKPPWVLGIECKSPTGAARAPKCWAASSSLGCIVFGMGILHCFLQRRMNLQRILFVHLYATSHLGGFETGENDFDIFF